MQYAVGARVHALGLIGVYRWRRESGGAVVANAVISRLPSMREEEAAEVLTRPRLPTFVSDRLHQQGAPVYSFIANADLEK